MTAVYIESDDTQKHIWKIERIWALAEHLDIIEIPIESIVGIDAVTWFSEEHPPTVRSVADHARRIQEADLSFPPILTARNRVFDGMHRIAKHLMLGKKTIRVKRFDKDPVPDQKIKL